MHLKRPALSRSETDALTYLECRQLVRWNLPFAGWQDEVWTIAPLAKRDLTPADRDVGATRATPGDSACGRRGLVPPCRRLIENVACSQDEK
jgi:hypothetical protein